MAQDDQGHTADSAESGSTASSDDEYASASPVHHKTVEPCGTGDAPFDTLQQAEGHRERDFCLTKALRREEPPQPSPLTQNRCSCRIYNDVFGFRNKLFAHLKTAGCHSPPPPPAPSLEAVKSVQTVDSEPEVEGPVKLSIEDHPRRPPRTRLTRTQLSVKYRRRRTK